MKLNHVDIDIDMSSSSASSSPFYGKNSPSPFSQSEQLEKLLDGVSCGTASVTTPIIVPRTHVIPGGADDNDINVTHAQHEPIHTNRHSGLTGTNKLLDSLRSVWFPNKKDSYYGNGHVFSRYRQSRFNARRVRKRIVTKQGDCNVVQDNIAKRRRKFLRDIFTTLVDAQWRWTLLVFALNFILSWLTFAAIWWLIAYTHGDFLPEHLNGTVDWTPCVENIESFTSCFLFSVETQHTIGYGSRSTTEECPEAIFVMCLQSIGGVILQAFMVGVVFAKLSRPKKRTQTLLFSRNAVICHRDGIPCLMFRVGDMRRSHIIEAHVRAQLIKHKVSKEGESLPFFQTELKVGGDGEEDKIFFIWPTTIVHKIDQDSPLFEMSATDLIRERFEIVVILEGVIESTGMTTQARSSYLPSEILWGHRFQSLVSFKKTTGEYEVNYAQFHDTIQVETPLCSARQLMHFQTQTKAEMAAAELGGYNTGSTNSFPFSSISFATTAPIGSSTLSPKSSINGTNATSNAGITTITTNTNSTQNNVCGNVEYADGGGAVANAQSPPPRLPQLQQYNGHSGSLCCPPITERSRRHSNTTLASMDSLPMEEAVAIVSADDNTTAEYSSAHHDSMCTASTPITVIVTDYAQHDHRRVVNHNENTSSCGTASTMAPRVTV